MRACVSTQQSCCLALKPRLFCTLILVNQYLALVRPRDSSRLPKDHRLCEKGKREEENSFHRKRLCFLTYLLMGDPRLLPPWLGELSALGRVYAQGGRCVRCHLRVVPGWHDALHRAPFCAAHFPVADRDPGRRPSPQQDTRNLDSHN
jgi:hypothetical protein